MKRLRALICFLTIGASLAGCDTPGQGRKADAAKKQGNEIINALSKHYETHGRYPGSLDELGAPFSSGKYKPGNGEVSFIYLPKENAYTLVLKYFGPGSNLCVHESDKESGSWDCTGSY